MRSRCGLAISQHIIKLMRFKKGQIAWNKGKHYSEETRKKISKSQKGINNTKEQNLNISLALKGRPKPKGKNSPNWKNVKRNYNTERIIKLEKLVGRKKPKQCEICGAMGRICFDHNHETGKFRGWICTRCNLALGLVKDNIEVLIEMIKYLKKQ